VDDDSGGTRIGRVRVPFPFSAPVGIIAVPVLLLAAGLSIPVSFVTDRFARRRERRFATQMRRNGRWMSWSQAQSEVESGRGTVIGEYLSPKSGYRLWWTSEDISVTSPYRCCFEEIPWGEAESSEFFEWCCSRFTNAEFGVGRLVDLESTDRKVVR
jgi:hypothetical protein